MWFSHSVKTTKPWMSILVVICIITEKYLVQACDESCKGDLLQGIEVLLKGKFDEIDTKIESKLNYLDSRMDWFEDKLISIESRVYTIDSVIANFDGRSSESQLNTQKVKAMQEEMLEQIQNLTSIVESFDERISNTYFEEVFTTKKSLESSIIQNITNNTDSLNKSIQNINKKALSLKQHMKEELDSQTIQIISSLDINNDELNMKIDKIEEQVYESYILLNGMKQDINMQIEAIEETEIESNSILNNVKEEMGLLHIPLNEIKAQTDVITRDLQFHNNLISTKINLIQSSCSASGQSDGFYLSGRCFKFFKDTTRSWHEAKLKCQADGLILAEPSDTVAVALTHYLHDIHGDGSVWLGAKGDGRKFVWERRRTPLKQGSDSLFCCGMNVVDYACLELEVFESRMQSHPGKPYDFQSCTNKYYTLCEVVRG